MTTEENDKTSEGKVHSKNFLNDLTGKEWVKHTISWFTIKPRPRKKNEKNHPGKYPEELCERFIEFFTKKGDWVLDPFLGVGSTLVASKTLGRNGLGIELNPNFVDTANEVLKTNNSLDHDTIQQIITGDACTIDTLLASKHFGNKFKLCITSPPYWNMLSKHRGGSDSQHRRRKEEGLQLVYSDSEKDLANLEDYNQYIESLISIFEKMKFLLTPDAYIVIIVQNIRDESGELKPIAWDLAYKLKNIYMLKQEQIRCQTDKPAGNWGYPKTYVSNVHHHYCLIFQNTMN